MKDFYTKLGNFCLEKCYTKLGLERKNFCAFRGFKTSEGFPIIFIFQNGAKYYICKTNVENEIFKQIPTLYAKKGHHQTKFQAVRDIVGVEIAEELIKNGLFFDDKKKQRNTEDKIKNFCKSKEQHENSTIQIQRLICLFKYQFLNIEGLQVHHISLDKTENKDYNICPLSVEEHSKIHYTETENGIYRSREEQLKRSIKTAEEFKKYYKKISPSNCKTKNEGNKKNIN